jgi:DNA-binding transcriptional ArsR family regulator
MLRPITVAPMFSNQPSTIGVLALTSPPSSPCVSRKALSGRSHSLSCIPPIPNGFSALCSGPATKPSSDIIMFSLSSLIAAPPNLLGYVWRSRILKHMLNQEPTLDRVFHALADPSRRSIVERLSRGSASVSALAEPLPISLPAVLQHLQVLEEGGVVRTEKVGRVRMCSIEVAALRPAERWIQERRAGWERRLDRLGEYLVEETDA